MSMHYCRWPVVVLVAGLSVAAGLSGVSRVAVAEPGSGLVAGEGEGLVKPPLVNTDWLPAAPWVDGTGAPAGESRMVASLGGGWSVSRMGQAQYTMPVRVLDGRAGMEPELALTYSGEGNGILGVGWSLSGAMSSITRCGKSLWTEGYVGGVHFKDPNASDQWSGGLPEPDRFCLDGQKLVAVNGFYGANGAEYRTEQESFSRIVSFTSTNQGPDKFVVTTKEGRTLTYSWNPGGVSLTGKQYAATANGLTLVGEKRMMWALERAEDQFGNFMTMDYSVDRQTTGLEQAEGSEVLLKAIRYTGNSGNQPGAVRNPLRVVEFSYELRSDVQGRWLGGVKGNSRQRLRFITAKVNRTGLGGMESVWRYELRYGALSTYAGRSLLASVERCATQPNWTPGSDDQTILAGSCWEKKEFAWYDEPALPTFAARDTGSGAPLSDSCVDEDHLPVTHYKPSALPFFSVADLDGNGLDDLLWQNTSCARLTDPPGTSPYMQVYSRRGTRSANDTPAPIQVSPLANFKDLTDDGTISSEMQLPGSSMMDMDGDGKLELWATRVLPGTTDNRQCEQTQLGWDMRPYSIDSFMELNKMPAYACNISKNNVNHIFADLDGNHRPELYTAQQRVVTSSGNPSITQIVPGIFDAHWLRRAAITEVMEPQAKGTTGLVAACSPQVVDGDGDGRAELWVQDWQEGTAANGWKYGCDGNTVRVLSQKEEPMYNNQPLYTIEEDTQGKYPRARKAGKPDAYPNVGEKDSDMKVDPTSYAGSSLTMADVNADGLMDALLAVNVTDATPNAPLQLAVRINTGNGYAPPVALGSFPSLGRMARNASGELVAGDWGFRVLDINGDGRQDLVFLEALPKTAEGMKPGKLHVLLSKGDGTFSQTTLSDFTGLNGMAGGWIHKAGWTTTRFGDFNGDGKVDLVSAKQTLVRDERYLGEVYRVNSSLYLYTQISPGVGNRLKWVKDTGHVPEVEFIYWRQWADKLSGVQENDGAEECYAENKRRCPQTGFNVVREVITRDHLQNVAYNPSQPEVWPAGNRLLYSYQGLVSNLDGDVVGFKKVRTFDPLRNVETVAKYDLDTVMRVGPRQRPVYPYANVPKQVTTTVPIYTGEQQAGLQPKPSNPTALVTRREALITEVKPFTYTNAVANSETVTTWMVLPRESRVRTWQQTVQVDTNLLSPNNPGVDRLWGVSEPSSGFIKEQKSTQGYDAVTGYLTFSEQATTGGETNTWVGTYYPDDKPKWFLGLLKEETIRNKQANPQTPTTLNFNRYTYDPNKGYLTKVEREPQASAASVRLVTQYTRNSLGQLVRVSESGMNSNKNTETRAMNLSYEDAESYLPGQVNERIYLTRTWPDVNPVLSYSVAHDPVWGVVVATQDGAGRYVQNKYDWAGRLVWSQAKVKDQNGTPNDPSDDQVKSLPQSTINYGKRPDCVANGVSYCAIGVQITRKEWNSAGVPVAQSTTLTNGLGQPLSQQGTAFDGSFSEVRYGYDQYNQLEWSTQPFKAGQALQKTWRQYDSLGRVSKVTLPDNAFSTLSYTLSTDPLQHLTTTVTDALLNEMKTVTDVDGRLVQSIEYLKEAAGNVKPLITRYEYGAGGLLQHDIVNYDPTDLQNPKKNLKSYYEYDQLGRVTYQKVVGAGFIQSDWTSFGELYKSQHLETEETTSTQFDGLGRVLSRVTRNEAGTALFQTQYGWNNVVSNGLGQVTVASATNGEAPLGVVHTVMTTYDVWGRPQRSTQSMANRTYISDVEYDAEGHIRSLTFPGATAQDRVKACYQYKSNGYLAEVGDIAPATQACPATPGGTGYSSLWKVNARDARGALQQGDLGNGVRAGRLYDPQTGRLNSVFATSLTNPALLYQQNYQYYTNGLVKNKADGVKHQKEEYSYDSLLRLVRAEQDNPLASTTTNRATYWSYDDLGNRLTKGTASYPKGSNAPASATTELERNEYLLPGKPHAVSRHSELLPNGQTQTTEYVYDGMGRQTAAQVPGQATIQRVQQYSAGGLLPRFITKDGQPTEYLYGAAGQRVMKSNQNGQIVYLGGMEIHRSNGSERYVVNVPGIEGALTQIVINPQDHSREKRYVLQDRQGTTGLVLDGQGVEKERYYYDPFGQRLNADGTPYTPPPNQSPAYLGQLLAGYTGQEMEEDIGVQNYNGRLRDTATGLFMVPDPISGPGQRANRYSYVMNSPINLIDPSGYCGQGAEEEPCPPIGPPPLEECFACFDGGYTPKPVPPTSNFPTYSGSGPAGGGKAPPLTVPNTNSVGGVGADSYAVGGGETCGSSGTGDMCYEGRIDPAMNSAFDKGADYQLNADYTQYGVYDLILKKSEDPIHYPSGEDAAINEMCQSNSPTGAGCIIAPGHPWINRFYGALVYANRAKKEELGGAYGLGRGLFGGGGARNPVTQTINRAPQAGGPSAKSKAEGTTSPPTPSGKYADRDFFVHETPEGKKIICYICTGLGQGLNKKPGDVVQAYGVNEGELMPGYVFKQDGNQFYHTNDVNVLPLKPNLGPPVPLNSPKEANDWLQAQGATPARTFLDMAKMFKGGEK